MPSAAIVSQRTLLILALSAIPACESGFESLALHVAWKLPSGVELQREVLGPRPRAEFNHGVVLQAIDDTPAEVTEPAAIAELARKQAGLPANDSASCRTGTLPIGPVVRCGLARGGDREMAHVVLVPGHSLLLDVAAAESVYGTLSAKVEGSLSTLRLR